MQLRLNLTRNIDENRLRVRRQINRVMSSNQILFETPFGVTHFGVAQGP